MDFFVEDISQKMDLDAQNQENHIEIDANLKPFWGCNRFLFVFIFLPADTDNFGLISLLWSIRP